MDAMSGELFAYPSVQDGDYRKADFVLPPAGSLLLFCSASDNQKYGFKPQLAAGRSLDAATPLQVKRVRDNALTLDFCDLIIDGKAEKNLYTVEACNKLYGHFGMGDPWNSAVQYKKNIVDRDTFRTGDIKVNYHFIVAGKVDRESLKLIAEQPDIWKVKVNGQPVASEGASFLDARWGTYSIGRWVKAVSYTHLTLPTKA